MRHGSFSAAVTPPDLLVVAKYLRARHLFGVPLRGDKRPLLPDWRHSTWRTRYAVFACGAAKGLGVQCGMRRGDTGLSLVVLDFDRVEDYEAWRQSSPEARRLAATAPTVKTRRGVHVYTLVRGEVRSWYATTCEGKASGNFVVAPPSIHPSGVPYAWVIPLADREIPIVADPSILPGWGPPKNHQTYKPIPISRQRREKREERREKTENTWANKATKSTCVELRVFGEGLASGPRPPEWVSAIIGNHVPTGPGQRNNALFKLATELVKGGASPEALRSLAPSIVAAWHRLALPAIRTKDPSISFGDFGRGLDWIEAHWRGPAVESRKLPDPAVVVALADANPFETGDRNTSRDRIASMLRALDCLHDGRAFALDRRTLAEMVGLSGTPVRGHLVKIVEAGLVAVVDRGQSGKPGDRRSARYRWTGPPIVEPDA